jgi:hypothetical protein
MTEVNTKAMESLSKYGRIRTLKVIGDEILTLVITDGFKHTATSTFDMVGDLLEHYPEFTDIETAITEKDLAIIILKK